MYGDFVSDSGMISRGNFESMFHETGKVCKWVGQYVPKWFPKKCLCEGSDFMLEQEEEPLD
jgi:hypothetical protein